MDHISSKEARIIKCQNCKNMHFQNLSEHYHYILMNKFYLSENLLSAIQKMMFKQFPLHFFIIFVKKINCLDYFNMFKKYLHDKILFYVFMHFV